MKIKYIVKTNAKEDSKIPNREIFLEVELGTVV